MPDGQKSLLHSQERLRAALEASATGTFHWNIRTGELDWDESLDKLFGVESDTAVRNLKAFIDRVHPDDQMLVAEHCRACAVEGADLEVEFRVVLPDGQIRWLYDRGKTISDADGNPSEMTGACVDITRRKHTESILQERAANSELGAEVGLILTQNQALRETLRRCCESIVDHLSAAFARIWTVSEDGSTLELQASAGLYTHIDGGHARVPVGKFKIGLIAAEREPHLTNDVLNDPRVGQPEWAREQGMRSFAGYPLIVGDRLVGVIALFARRPLGPDTLQALGSISNSVALGIERKRNETALAAGEARKTAILETALDCFITVDGDSRILEFNHAAEVTFGYKREDVIGRLMPDIIMPPEFRQRHYHGVQTYLATGNARILGRRLELRGMRSDGTEFPVELAVNSIAAEGSCCFTATLRDISDRKDWEQRLEQARAEAEAASRAKSDFLASMSHELRTPLNAIIGYGEMLQEEAEELGAASLVSDLRKIHSAGKHLLSLINDVLDLSKIEAGKMELSIEDFSIAGLVEEVINVAGPLARQNGNSMEVVVDPDAITMRADVTKVRQSLLNVVSNAAKFTSNGKIRVHAGFDPANTNVLFRVEDTGIGLRADQMESLFQAFQQAEGNAARRFGGTGLGLALTRRFCRLMGGDVSVESEFGKGSVFTIRLPRVVSAKEQAGRRAGTTAAERIQDGRNTVLIIDDDPTACELIQRQVTREGFQSVIARSGMEGLALAKEVHPALITLDVMMPGMDGWTVLAALKRTPGLENIPVVMLTMVDDRNLGYALGASEFLTKPIERDSLAAILRKYACAAPPCCALLIDDDADSRRLVSHQLAKEGWEVLEAGNGQEGLARVSECIPSLILLDLMMPVMDGFEFSIELRRRQEWQNIPIVVLTSKDLTDEERARLNGQVQRVMMKGAYTREHLLEELSRTARRCVEDARIRSA